MRRKWGIGAAICTLAVASGWCATARADFTNGGFESGLSGWTATGTVLAANSVLERGIGGAPPWTPSAGNAFAALFSADGQFSSASLEQSFMANAGDTLRFDYFFDFGDLAGFNDTGVAELIGPSGPATTLFAYNVSGGVFLDDFENAGWNAFAQPLADDGVYTLRFTTMDFDGTFESVLGVDNVRLQPIPAPGAAMLAIMGLGGTWVAHRLRRKPLPESAGD